MLFDVKKYLLPSAVLAALTLVGCGDQPQQQGGALPVDVYVVTTENVPVISHLTGRANPTRKAEVRPQVTGILQNIPAELYEAATIDGAGRLRQVLAVTLPGIAPTIVIMLLMDDR